MENLFVSFFIWRLLFFKLLILDIVGVFFFIYIEVIYWFQELLRLVDFNSYRF